ncbi:MAG TPA: hypothetical protein VFF79_09160 [Conexibacter sp.]|jgi:hypothetical protein|nr:hypothetical protein [Conexibacter sp.]
MADIAGFVTEVHRLFGMRPVVPLEFPIEIGDIGTIGNDGVWRPISTVRHRFNGFPGRVRRTADGRVWEACSGDDVTFKLYERGETSALIPAPAHAKARAEITFRSRDAFVLAARGVTIRTAIDMDALIDKIHLAYHTRRERPEEGRWYKDFTFVFAVADAERFTALMPARDAARVAITPKGASSPPGTPDKLASVVGFGPGAEDLERTNQRDARGRFYRAYKLRPEVLARWRDEPWTHSRGDISFAWATPSFEDTFAEV